jgi:hypothetical protein
MPRNDIRAIRIRRPIDPRDHITQLDGEIDPIINPLEVALDLHIHVPVGFIGKGAHLLEDPVAGGADPADGVRLVGEGVACAEGGERGDDGLDAGGIDLGEHGREVRGGGLGDQWGADGGCEGPGGGEGEAPGGGGGVDAPWEGCPGLGGSERG